MLALDPKERLTFCEQHFPNRGSVWQEPWMKEHRDSPASMPNARIWICSLSGNYIYGLGNLFSREAWRRWANLLSRGTWLFYACFRRKRGDRFEFALFGCVRSFRHILYLCRCMQESIESISKAVARIWVWLVTTELCTTPSDVFADHLSVHASIGFGVSFSIDVANVLE